MLGVVMLIMSFIVMGVLASNNISNSSGSSNAVSAMFVFGDSLVDNGNNNFLRSIAKSNYYPYGVDSKRGATGKFSNGDTFVDYLGTYHFIHRSFINNL